MTSESEYRTWLDSFEQDHKVALEVYYPSIVRQVHRFFSAHSVEEILRDKLQERDPSEARDTLRQMKDLLTEANLPYSEIREALSNTLTQTVEERDGLDHLRKNMHPARILEISQVYFLARNLEHPGYGISNIRQTFETLFKQGDRVYPEGLGQWVEAARNTAKVGRSELHRTLWYDIARSGIEYVTHTDPIKFSTAVDLLDRPYWAGKKGTLRRAIKAKRVGQWVEAAAYRNTRYIDLSYTQEKHFLELCMGIGKECMRQLGDSDLVDVLGIRASLTSSNRVLFDEGCKESIKRRTLRPWLEHILESLKGNDITGGSRYREVSAR